MSVEDLLNIEVTSVSKKEQPLSRAGAAIFVITQEDIRRSGATNIPEVLRLAPGVDVAQIDRNTWAVSVRGFNDRYSDKVLVLIDGRSIYSPATTGVFWDGSDVPLEDIERIEVIRGPGGTVWGANAVNGVINIITKSAKSTQGGLLTAGTGSSIPVQGLMQYGGQVGQIGTYRLFGTYSNNEPGALPDGGRAADGWHATQGGFRSDWDLTKVDSLTVQGDFREALEGETVTSAFVNELPLLATVNDLFTQTTGNVLGRWTHTLANGSQTSLQLDDSYFFRNELGVGDKENTVNADFQHHLKIGGRQDVVWGLGARSTSMRFTPGYSISFTPDQERISLFGAFVQDEIELSESVSLTVGSKFENNSFTGFAMEPSAQLVWAPTPRQSLWASAARAIRQPSMTDFGIKDTVGVIPAGPNTFETVTLLGDPSHVKNEIARDFEVGYRAQLSKRLSVDVATFYSLYSNLGVPEPDAPTFVLTPGPPHLDFPLVLSYIASGHSFGGELFLNWNVGRRWRISPGYTGLHLSMFPNPAAQGIPPNQNPGYSPAEQAEVRSQLDLPHNLEWDTTISYVGALPDSNIGAYTRVDTRLGWRVGEYVDLSLVGQNLLTPRHAEFPDEYELDHMLIERSVFAKLTWRF